MKHVVAYPPSIARFYDIIYGHLRTVDHDFFMGKILGTKGPVLEVGVGTGRFFLEALNRGADISGLDVSESMLGELKKKLDSKHHNRLFLQDVRTMELGKQFDLIVAPFRVFSHLLEVDDQLQALAAIHRHLKPGGTFIFDLYVPDLKLLHDGIHDQTDFDGEYAPGLKLRRVISASPDLVSQINDITMTLTWDEAGGIKTETWHTPMRFYFRFELEHLVNRSPLTLEHIFGDYEEHVLGPESKDFIVVCRRD